MSFRHAGRMRHLGIGIEHAGKRGIAVADDHTITVIHLDTGEVIASNDIQPDKAYWRNTQKAPPADGRGLPRDSCRDSSHGGPQQIVGKPVLITPRTGPARVSRHGARHPNATTCENTDEALHLRLR